MSKVAHGRVLVSQNGAESYRGQSSWLVVLRGQSVVLISQRGQSFFAVSRLDRCGQSSWSVVYHGQSFFVDGVYILWWLCTLFTETYGWGKPRSMSEEMYGGWVEHV